MSRTLKVAVREDFLELVQNHKQKFSQERAGMSLKFVGIPEPSKIIESELAETLEGVEVALLNPPQFLPVSKCMSSSLKWIQSSRAGVDVLQDLDTSLQSKLKRCIITRAGGVYPLPMSEYVIGAIIAMERKFPAMYRRQWHKNWQTTCDVMRYRTLPSLSIGILGLGDIGKQVAKMCSRLGMRVYGLKRTLTLCDHVEKVFSMKELPDFLQSSDYICNVLPSTPETRGLLSGNALQTCAGKMPGFINIGRGDVIDEKSIIAALNNGWISNAFLDVFEEEPLPKSSPLWLMENVAITPHVSAAGGEDGVVDLFFSNLKKFLNKEEMDFVHTWEKPY